MADLQAKINDMRPPASHRNDPESSYLAEDRANKSGRRYSDQKTAYRAVRDYPSLTSAELAFRTGLDRSMLARRLPELTPHVIKGKSRTCDINDSLAVTWILG